MYMIKFYLIFLFSFFYNGGSGGEGMSCSFVVGSTKTIPPNLSLDLLIYLHQIAVFTTTPLPLFAHKTERERERDRRRLIEWSEGLSFAYQITPPNIP